MNAGAPNPVANPAPERVLWQGRPTWRAILRHVFHLRALSLYFVLILLWQIYSAVTAGQPGQLLMASTAAFTSLALLCLAILALMAWLIWRTTSYLITDRRVVMRFGVAIPATLDVPLNLVQNASVKIHPDGTGDIALALPADQRIAPLLLWPHVKPWQLNKPEPMLRGIDNPERVASIFASALAASVPMPGGHAFDIHTNRQSDSATGAAVNNPPLTAKSREDA
jgi:hypothetical protein